MKKKAIKKPIHNIEFEKTEKKLKELGIWILEKEYNKWRPKI